MKNKKNNVITMVDPEMQARKNFSSHVQSIAFNLSMSRRMIDCLQAVRDYGWPHFGDKESAEWWKDRKEHESVITRIHHRDSGSFVTHNFVGFMNALSNRGLIYWNPTPEREKKKGDRTLLLSHAGELVCDLLVECDLMPAREDTREKINSNKGR